MLAFALVGLISIAMVLALLKIGSQAYGHQHMLAQANDLISQCAQISMAIRIFRSDGHLIEESVPKGIQASPSPLLQALEDKGYLNDIPLPRVGGAFQVTWDGTWTQFGKPQHLVDVITASDQTGSIVGDKLCAELNRRNSNQFGCLEGTAQAGNVFWYHAPIKN